MKKEFERLSIANVEELLLSNIPVLDVEADKESQDQYIQDMLARIEENPSEVKNLDWKDFGDGIWGSSIFFGDKEKSGRKLCFFSRKKPEEISVVNDLSFFTQDEKQGENVGRIMRMGKLGDSWYVSKDDAKEEHAEEEKKYSLESRDEWIARIDREEKMKLARLAYMAGDAEKGRFSTTAEKVSKTGMFVASIGALSVFSGTLPLLGGLAIIGGVFFAIPAVAKRVQAHRLGRPQMLTGDLMEVNGHFYEEKYAQTAEFFEKRKAPENLERTKIKNLSVNLFSGVVGAVKGIGFAYRAPSHFFNPDGKSAVAGKMAGLAGIATFMVCLGVAAPLTVSVLHGVMLGSFIKGYADSAKSRSPRTTYNSILTKYANALDAAADVFMSISPAAERIEVARVIFEEKKRQRTVESKEEKSLQAESKTKSFKI